MGLFKRKDSRNSVQSERDEGESFVTVNSARTSNTSLRSPGYKGSGLPTSIPEMPIAKPPDPALDPAAYLRSIHAVRERANVILERAKRNRLNHFDVDLSKFRATASYIVSIIKVNMPPYHRPKQTCHNWNNPNQKRKGGNNRKSPCPIHLCMANGTTHIGRNIMLIPVKPKERLRARLCKYPTAWPLATFRRGRPTPYQPTPSVLAQPNRCPRAHAPAD